jgi:hypothetical protein
VGRNREQASREFGIKFAKALREKAHEAGKQHDLDPRYIMLGAADYLRKDAEFKIDPPIDTSRADPEERDN